MSTHRVVLFAHDLDSKVSLLKRCPFCGSSRHPEPRVTSELDDPEEFYIWCGMCKCSGPESLTEEGAALVWNSRPQVTHGEMSERGRKHCNCKQCADSNKHPCSRALWAASIALKLLIEERGGTD